MFLIEDYLNKLNSKNHLEYILSKYEKVIVYKTDKDITLGLLRFKTPPLKTAFLFEFDDEEIRYFHTNNMKFNIDIFFFDKKGEITFSYENVFPGEDHISSKKPSKYVVEVPSKHE